jgi:hypothetical protein
MERCKFPIHEYFDLELKINQIFQCKEPPFMNGYCIFHIGYDKDTYPELFRDKVIDRLKAKLYECLENDKPIYCIGYFIPTLQLGNITFTKPVYFNFAKFLGYSNFSRSYFFAGADFSAAEFHKDTGFIETKFHVHAGFLATKFKDSVSFSKATFHCLADFASSVFFKETEFTGAEFKRKAQFSLSQFEGLTRFSLTKFRSIAIFSGSLFKDGGEQTIFDIEDLSRVSFLESDVTRIRFSETTSWGSDRNHKFKIYDERDFEMYMNHKFKWTSIIKNGQYAASFIKFLEFIGVNWVSNDCHFDYLDNNVIGIFQTNTDNKHGNKTSKYSNDSVLENQRSYDYPQVTIHADPNNNEAVLKADGHLYYTFKLMKENSGIYLYPWETPLEGVIASYRNLRENYEYRMRYYESGQFFIREMELQRNYHRNDEGVTKRTCRFKRNLSATGLYHFFSLYGESLTRPFLVGLGILLFSTFFWLIQSQPSLEPHFFDNPIVTLSSSHIIFSKLIGFAQIENLTHWTKAVERASADFIPVLQLGSKIEVGLFDYTFKIIGGVLTFGLLAIALRRKFERRFRH